MILLNGVLAGAEIAIVSIRKTRLMELVERKTAWAVSAKTLRDNPERFLATVQVGITVIGTTAGAFGGSTLAIHLIPLFQSITWLRPYAEEVAVGLVVVFISYLTIVVGELVPKSLAMRAPELYGQLVASPLLWLSRISSPAVRLLASSSNLLLRAFGDKTSFTEARLSSDEIRHLVEDAAKVGSLHPGASSIASRAIDFGDLRVVDVMVQRGEVISVPAEATLDEVADQFEKTPFSRLPVHCSSKDEIIGYLAAKDFLLKGKRSAGKARQAGDLLRQAIFVPESAKAIHLLHQFQKERQQIAFVVDEHGVFLGLVTMEDLLEELVGEIFSEFREESIPEIRWDSDGTALVQGRTPIREVNRHLDLDLPEGEFGTTLGGLCLSRAGHIPAPSECLDLGNGIQAEILKTEGTRILSVRIQKVSEFST